MRCPTTFRHMGLILIPMLLLLGCGQAEKEILSNSVKESSRQGKEYSYPSYYPDEDKTKFTGYGEYPPSNYVTYKEEAPQNCPPSPFLPVLSNGLNFLALKLGAIGLVKSIFAILFIIFLFKLPLILAKAVFFKAFLFPAFLAPFLMLFSGSGNNMMSAMMPDSMKPTESTGSDEGTNGRAFDENFATTTWQTMRLLLDSERCAERMACQMGALNNDTMSGAALGRMMKYIEHSSPSSTKVRIRSMREAFIEGNQEGSCSSEIYKCQPPRLFIQQGDSQLKVL